MEPLFRIEFADETWDRFDRVLKLNYEILYRPFGVGPDCDWYHSGPGVHAIALAGRHLLGSARLLGVPGEPSRQLRQVVVEPAVQGQGIGRALVESLERRAADEGTVEVWLNARDTAYAFYVRLGYEFADEEFESPLTRVPHRRMIHRLGPRRA
jgi:GNAT superfamily N-acetyltransferase